MQAENNNDIAITEAKLKDFLSSVLSSEGIVVDIRRTFIEYNGVNRSRVFARHANRMACKGSIEKFVVIALLCSMRKRQSLCHHAGRTANQLCLRGCVQWSQRCDGL